MAQHSVPSARETGGNARKRVYGLMLAVFLNGVAAGLLLAPAVADRGSLVWGVLLSGLFVLAVSVTRWRDPL